MLEGLKAIKERVDEVQQMSQGDFINVLGIKDNEFATLRFLTDEDKVIVHPIHFLEEDTPKGKRWPRKYCTMEETGMCEHCATGHKPTKCIFLWAYVYNIIHTQQNPSLEFDPSQPRWSNVKVDGRTMYKQEVNGPMIFRLKSGQNQKYQKMIIDFWKEYGSLTDRDYKFTRSGASKDTIYNLIPRDPATKMTKEVSSVAESLPDLADYVRGKIFTFSQPVEEVEKFEIDNSKKSDKLPEKDLF